MSKKKISFIDASSLETPDWVKIWADGLKIHFVHKSLLASLIVDLESRGYPIESQEYTEKARVEFPSYIHFANRPEEIVRIDSLDVEIPSKDVSITVEVLMNLPIRYFVGGERYFKLKSEMTCIVFTEDQKSLFTAGLMNLAPQAEERDKVFMDKMMKKLDRDGS